MLEQAEDPAEAAHPQWFEVPDRPYSAPPFLDPEGVSFLSFPPEAGKLDMWIEPPDRPKSAPPGDQPGDQEQEPPPGFGTEFSDLKLVRSLGHSPGAAGDLPRRLQGLAVGTSAVPGSRLPILDPRGKGLFAFQAERKLARPSQIQECDSSGEISDNGTVPTEGAMSNIGVGASGGGHEGEASWDRNDLYALEAAAHEAAPGSRLCTPPPVGSNQAGLHSQFASPGRQTPSTRGFGSPGSHGAGFGGLMSSTWVDDGPALLHPGAVRASDPFDRPFSAPPDVEHIFAMQGGFCPTPDIRCDEKYSEFFQLYSGENVNLPPPLSTDPELMRSRQRSQYDYDAADEGCSLPEGGCGPGGVQAPGAVSGYNPATGFSTDHGLPHHGMVGAYHPGQGPMPWENAGLGGCAGSPSTHPAMMAAAVAAQHAVAHQLQLQHLQQQLRHEQQGQPQDALQAGGNCSHALQPRHFSTLPSQGRDWAQLPQFQPPGSVLQPQLGVMGPGMSAPSQGPGSVNPALLAGPPGAPGANATNGYSAAAVSAAAALRHSPLLGAAGYPTNCFGEASNTSTRPLPGPPVMQGVGGAGNVLNLALAARTDPALGCQGPQAAALRASSDATRTGMASTPAGLGMGARANASLGSGANDRRIELNLAANSGPGAVASDSTPVNGQAGRGARGAGSTGAKSLAPGSGVVGSGAPGSVASGGAEGTSGSAAGNKNEWEVADRKPVRGLKVSHLEEMFANNTYIHHIYQIARDQAGCRMLQQRLDEGGAEATAAIFSEVLSHCVDLMMDPFGNYLCQKLMETCGPSDLELILDKVCGMPGALVKIALNMHGARAVQKLIDVVKGTPYVPRLVSALEGSVAALTKDANGNHVVQRCLEALPQQAHGFIFRSVAEEILDVATHRHGCRIVQRCIDAAYGVDRQMLTGAICQNSLTLVQDPFGNYVVQYVLGLRDPKANSAIIKSISGWLNVLSRQKFSSNVVEKCLNICTLEEREKMIIELSDARGLGELLRDVYGNYVVQSALASSPEPLLSMFLGAVRPLLPSLRAAGQGRRIAQKLEKKYPQLKSGGEGVGSGGGRGGSSIGGGSAASDRGAPSASQGQGPPLHPGLGAFGHVSPGGQTSAYLGAPGAPVAPTGQLRLDDALSGALPAGCGTGANAAAPGFPAAYGAIPAGAANGAAQGPGLAPHARRNRKHRRPT